MVEKDWEIDEAIDDESAGFVVLCQWEMLRLRDDLPAPIGDFFDIVQKWGWGKTHVQKHCCKFYIVRTLVS